MGLRVIHRVALVGVLAIAVLVLALVLVPVITAGLPPISDVGNVDEGVPPDLQKCLMYDPTSDPEPGETGVTLEANSPPFIVDKMYELNPELYPNVNVLMRCEAQIDNYVGPAFQISGNDYGSDISCVVALEPDAPYPKYKDTVNWNQTISSSGNVVLICRFKK